MTPFPLIRKYGDFPKTLKRRVKTRPTLFNPS
jgi:hypothetical protein